MEIINKKLSELKPYEKNPRKNDNAVDYVAKSIEEFGFKVPIVIDKDNVIIAGHTRYQASEKLGLNEVPCVIADDLTDEQVKAFRLADNKVSEMSEWDYDLLDIELDDIVGIDMEDFGFLDFNSFEDEEKEKKSKYTQKVDIPQYEVQGDNPFIDELIDKEKVKYFIEEIESANISDEQKEFLKIAATRHFSFNYSKIAEYYAHQDKEMQELMEHSALVLIDIDNAIANGYVKLSQDIEDMINNEE